MKDETLAILAAELREANQDDLAIAVERLEAEVKLWWQNHMQWSFTDHGVGHSRRVARYAAALVSVIPLAPGLALNVMERYLLITAAWLHDIGMQNAHESQSREEVRKQHPQRSHDLIIGAVGDPFDVGTVEGQVLDTLATIVRAHGTSYYEDTIRSAPDTIAFRDFRVRPTLLAALLLLADELDLNSERAKTQAVRAELENETKAHWLKHQCVASISLSAVRSAVAITVELAFPSNLDITGQIAIQKWIGNKLQKQIALVDSEIDRGFDGAFSFHPVILFKRRATKVPNAYARPEVIAIIRSENARDELINHRDALVDGRAALLSGRNVAVVGADSLDGLDSDGRSDLMAALVADCRAREVVVADAARWERGTSPACSDVLASWMMDLGIEPPAPLDETAEPARRSALLTALSDGLGAGKAPTVLTLRGWDQLTSEAAEWFETVAVTRLSAPSHVSVIVSATMQTRPSTRAAWQYVEVGETEQMAVQDFTRQRLGRRSAQLKTTSLSYSVAKQFEFDTSAELSFSR